VSTPTSSRPIGLLALIGLFAGGWIGFLLRPSAMLIGQLPFETVISRGAGLKGLDLLLVSTAEQSFNMLVAGAVIGALAGVFVGFLSTGQSEKT